MAIASKSSQCGRNRMDAERVQVLMVSVDPERDFTEALARYVTAFDPRFLGLRATSGLLRGA